MDKHARRRHDAQKRSVNVASANRASIEASPGGTRANADLASEAEAVSRLGAEQSDSLNEMRKAYKLCREVRPRLYDARKAILKGSASVVLDKETAEFMEVPRTHNAG